MVSFHRGWGTYFSHDWGKRKKASVHDLASKKPQEILEKQRKTKSRSAITIIIEYTENETIYPITIILFILIELEYYRTSDCHDPPKHPLPVTIPLRLISAASVGDDDEN